MRASTSSSLRSRSTLRPRIDFLEKHRALPDPRPLRNILPCARRVQPERGGGIEPELLEDLRRAGRDDGREQDGADAERLRRLVETVRDRRGPALLVEGPG